MMVARWDVTREDRSEFIIRHRLFACMYFEKYSRDNYIGCEYHDTTKIIIQDGHRRQYPLQDRYRRQCPLLQLPLLVRQEAL